MSFRKTIFAALVIGASIPAAFASSGGTWKNGEIGFVPNPTESTRSRADVQKELASFHRNPVAADGGRLVGGEVGHIAPQHTYVLRDGKLAHTDHIAHNTTKPSLSMTDAERRLSREQFVN